MRISIVILGICISMCAMAQTDSVKKKKPEFQTTIRAGIMEGEVGTSFQLQAINGFTYKTYSAGIGVGIDYYVMRTIPVFLSLQKDLLARSQTPFIYTDAGVHFPWAGKSHNWMTDTDPGLFYDLGLGYKFVAKSNAITISAGYSFKAYAYETNYFPPCGIIGPCPEPVSNYYKYKLRRLSVKVGFIF